MCRLDRNKVRQKHDKETSLSFFAPQTFMTYANNGW